MMLRQNFLWSALAAATGEGTPAGGETPLTETAGTPEPRPQVPADAQRVNNDPMMTRLVESERALEAMRKENEVHRAALKKHERDAKKGTVLNALYDEFPGMARHEIRGAALVAAEDGEVDLFSDDATAVVTKLKERLTPKSKKAATPAPTEKTSLGGTPGAPGKANGATPRFLI